MANEMVLTAGTVKRTRLPKTLPGFLSWLTRNGFRTVRSQVVSCFGTNMVLVRQGKLTRLCRNFEEAAAALLERSPGRTSSPGSNTSDFGRTALTLVG